MSLMETKSYLNLLVIDAFLANDTKIAQAEEGGISGAVSGLISAVKEYAEGQIDPNNKIGSVFNILAPGMLAALGGRFSILGGLLWAAEEFFDFKPDKILGEIVSGLKGAIMGGNVSPAQVDQAANQAVSDNFGGAPSEELLKKLTASLSFREAQIYKLVLLNVISQAPIDGKLSTAQRVGLTSMMLRLMGVKHTTASLLSKVLGWIVKTVLISCGFMAAGALISKMTGHSASFSPGNNSSSEAPTTITSTQQLFKPDPTYQGQIFQNGWIEPTPPSNIENQLIAWTEALYPDLRGKDDFIRSSSDLQAIVHYIQQYNANNTTNATFIPKKFNSRQSIVNSFIDDLVNKAIQIGKSMPNAPGVNQKPETTEA